MSKQPVAESARATTDFLDSAVLVRSDAGCRSDVERRVIPQLVARPLGSVGASSSACVTRLSALIPDAVVASVISM